MKLFIFIVMLMSTVGYGGTQIVYQYDAQHRLVAVDYSELQTDAHVTYQYDAANNLDLEVSITDGTYLKSFLWYLADRNTMDSGWVFILCPREQRSALAPSLLNTKT